MLQTFTLSYPDSKSYGPKIYVIFTNFSKHFDSDEDLNSKYFEYDSDHENQNESDQNNESESIQKTKNAITFENLIKQFKENMIE